MACAIRSPFLLKPPFCSSKVILTFISPRYPESITPTQFASWISVEFELYIIKEFQRLKTEEQQQLGWSAKRELSKINYRIHTDAIKQNLIPAEVTAKQASIIYADEADMLNVAMFGMTAKMWREQHPELKGNIRDYATINELICLSNMENLNAVFIDQGIPQGDGYDALRVQSRKKCGGIREEQKVCIFGTLFAMEKRGTALYNRRGEITGKRYGGTV
jgi:hypothetical protein